MALESFNSYFSYLEAIEPLNDAERGRFVYVGDSPNDAPMFAFFPNAVGVANVVPFLDRIALTDAQPA